jgi:hypothetical protein
MLLSQIRAQGRGELLVSLCWQPAANRLTVVVLKARNLPKMDVTGLAGKARQLLQYGSFVSYHVYIMLYRLTLNYLKGKLYCFTTIANVCLSRELTKPSNRSTLLRRCTGVLIQDIETLADSQFSISFLAF